jgi:hypothetical protein
MVALKQNRGGQTRMLAMIVVGVAVIFSSVAFYSSSLGSCGEATMHGAQEAALGLAESRVRMATSLSSKESYGWFDNIPEEGWQLMKQRARTAVQYMYPLKPQTGYENPIMWYLDNIQVSRPFSYWPTHNSSDVSVRISLTRNIPIFFFSLISLARTNVVWEDTVTVPSGCATLTVC